MFVSIATKHPAGLLLCVVAVVHGASDVSSVSSTGASVEVAGFVDSPRHSKHVVRTSRTVKSRRKEWVPPTAEEKSDVDQYNAKEAANSAEVAAEVAGQVATHSIHVTEHATSALRNAHQVLHEARVDAEGLSKDQTDLLRKAERRLHSATRVAQWTTEKNRHYHDADRLHGKLGSNTTYISEVHGLHDELSGLRGRGSADMQHTVEELEVMTEHMDDEGGKSRDEMKAEVERLRDSVERYEASGAAESQTTHSVSHQDVQSGEVTHDISATSDASSAQVIRQVEQAEVVESGSKGIDIDTEMPYGELEPFGREDTAQELTEASIRESDEMVDQLERAEVAEEKRSVFRALTRLRGAAITSFDGVARSQTGNIDEYNKVHKWRKTHPLHHLADEESDVSKWAFPDNADF